jgi:uncharacterized integral membrane protein
LRVAHARFDVCHRTPGGHTAVSERGSHMYISIGAAILILILLIIFVF